MEWLSFFLTNCIRYSHMSKCHETICKRENCWSMYDIYSSSQKSSVQTMNVLMMSKYHSHLWVHLPHFFQSRVVVVVHYFLLLLLAKPSLGCVSSLKQGSCWGQEISPLKSWWWTWNAGARNEWNCSCYNSTPIDNFFRDHRRATILFPPTLLERARAQPYAPAWTRPKPKRSKKDPFWDLGHFPSEKKQNNPALMYWAFQARMCHLYVQSLVFINACSVCKSNTCSSPTSIHMGCDENRILGKSIFTR